ncbi:uncharacterized protein LOC136074020 [Hydra vulgaris]|uniref:Uncharacterized protein LOC136074020 n=1 Tax=Hydra vulgaris TaxID=6087 RepID=A0ABM4B0U5_HYDVU
MDYMLTNNLLNSNQHGFRKNKSCTTNLLETQYILFDAIENHWCVDMLYTDFSKAFDKVPRLMLKLKSYGIFRVILNWIEAYLHNRRQRVILGDCVSKWLTVDSGVPQDEDINKLQLDIDNIMKWSSLWLMNFNYKKCKIMHIGFKNPCIIYSMFDAETQQNNILATSKVERDLENGYEETNWINDSISKVQFKPYNICSHNQKLTKIIRSSILEKVGSIGL